MALDGGRWQSWAGAEWLVGVDGVAEPVRRLAEVTTIAFIWPVALAFAIDMYYRSRYSRGPGWSVAHAFGTSLLGLGAGGAIAVVSHGVAPRWPIALCVLGALALTARPAVERRAGIRARRQSWSRMHGTPAAAVVTAVSTEKVANVRRWRVTLRYEDSRGRTRWHRTSIPMGPRVLPRTVDRHTVRYDPQHPGRRSSIVVEPRTPATRR
ncbi:hypothetical protein [Jiangella endophytica]|uniref:hypothetical protein n=1 Tax=Jiangella endophytica TaxID=1623398 RepID=UPI000E35478E|nr:hypothetical protein [Jiangella endophytica]